MKYLYIVIFLLSKSFIFSQKVSLIIRKDLYLNIDYYANTFEVKNYIVRTFTNSDCVDIRNYKLAGGNIKKNDFFISGYISNKQYFRLKKIDIYKYIVIDSREHLQPGKIIYAASYKDKYTTVQNMKWLNGKKTGNWLYVDLRSTRKYILKYKHDKMIDSIPSVNKDWQPYNSQ